MNDHPLGLDCDALGECSHWQHRTDPAQWQRQRRAAWQERFGAAWEAENGRPSPMRADAADRKVSWWLLQLRYHDDYAFKARQRTPILLNAGTPYQEPFGISLALNWARRIAEVELA